MHKLSALAASAAMLVPPFASAETTVIEAARYLDVVQGRYVSPAVIAVEGDPLADVKVLEDVRFVMKGGVVYKSP